MIKVHRWYEIEGTNKQAATLQVLMSYGSFRLKAVTEENNGNL